MKTKILSIVILVLCTANQVLAQSKTKFDVVLESSLAYPLSKFTVGDAKPVVRYSSEFGNILFKENIHIKGKFGIALQTGINNVGLIHRLNDSIKLKQRAYVIPLGFQLNIGDQSERHFFIGGQYNLAFNYKEKTWLNKESKIKSNEWFSDKVNLFTPVLYLGYQYSNKNYVKVQYQIGNFINENYLFNIRGVNTRIIQSNSVNIVFGTVLDFKNAGKATAPSAGKDVEIQI